MKKNEIYLVTGAAGFVGSCLVRRLVSQGCQVNVLVRKDSALWRIQDIQPKLKVHNVDLSDFESLVSTI